MSAIIAGIGIGFLLYLAYKWLSRRRENSLRTPPVWLEYWVYCHAETKPGNPEILKEMFGGTRGIGPAEGATLSDVRFHIGFVKREKNAMVFRPDIFSEVDTEIPMQLRESLQDTNAVVIVRFVSEEAMSTNKHLAFVVHAVDAIAKLTRAKLIWDTEAQRFWQPEVFSKSVMTAATGFEPNIVTHWTETPFEGRAFTRGMAKVGLPDLEFAHQPLDQRTLATYLVEETARQIWGAGKLQPCTFENFGELFEVAFTEPRSGKPTHRSRISTILASRKRRVVA